MLNRVKATYNEFPSRFWVLVGAHFIDGIGRTVLFPFFALYVTQKFQVGMTEAGILLAIFSVASFAGNMLGGALTDRFGRRTIILFGLVFSAMSSLAMGFVESLAVFYPLAAFVGLLSDVAGPASSAMVADLLPERQRSEGFGVMRVAGNLSWIVGPTIGGFLAAQSYLLLFIMDAALSLTTALIVYRFIPETMPERAEGEPGETIAESFAGYRRVLADNVFVAFMAISILMNMVYIQMYSTFSVYLRDVHAIPTQQYGVLMSFNASLVVIAQFWVSRQTKRYPPMLMMALGSGLYMVGFGLFGLVAAYALFFFAMALVTFGEMIVIPVAMALVARFAPVAMRGRYMAVFGLSWAIPAAVGPWAAGLILDNLNPHLVWYVGSAFSAVAVIGFALLQRRSAGRLATEAEGEIVPELAPGDLTPL